MVVLGMNLVLEWFGVIGEMVVLELFIVLEVIFVQGVKVGEVGNYVEVVELFFVVFNLSLDLLEIYYNCGLVWERLGNVD